MCLAREGNIVDRLCPRTRTRYLQSAGGSLSGARGVYVSEMPAKDLPRGVSHIVEHVGQKAAPTGNLDWREEDRIKADMMNVPRRWMPVDVRAFQIKCYEVGLTAASTGALVRFLRRIQEGRRLRPHDKGFRFPIAPD